MNLALFIRGLPPRFSCKAFLLSIFHSFRQGALANGLVTVAPSMSDAALLATRRRRLAQALHKTSRTTEPCSEWPTTRALDNTNVTVMRAVGHFGFIPIGWLKNPKTHSSGFSGCSMPEIKI